MTTGSHLGKDTSWGARCWAGYGGGWAMALPRARPQRRGQGRCPVKGSRPFCMTQQCLLSEFHSAEQKLQAPCDPASPGVSTQGLCPSAPLGENIQVLVYFTLRQKCCG